MAFEEHLANPVLFNRISGDHQKTDTLFFRGYWQSFLISTWLLKDNSINIGDVILIDSLTNEIGIDKNPTLFSNSKGEYKSVYLTEDEIREALAWQNKLYPFLMETTYESENDKYGLQFNNSNKRINYKSTNRLSRAVRFVGLARCESFLPAKITFYISALESLLSDTNAELKFQVADRSVRILGGSFEGKIKTLKIITDAYEFRSKYIHGTAGKIASEELLVDIDEILRKVLRIFLTDLNYVIQMKDEEFRNWLKELLYK